MVKFSKLTFLGFAIVMSGCGQNEQKSHDLFAIKSLSGATGISVAISATPLPSGFSPKVNIKEVSGLFNANFTAIGNVFRPAPAGEYLANANTINLNGFKFTPTVTPTEFNLYEDSKTSVNIKYTGVDIQPPTIDIITDRSIYTISDIAQIKAVVSDNDYVKKVEFYENNVLVFTDNMAPFEYQKRFNIYDNKKSVVFSAKAYDLIGNIGVSTSDSFTIVKEFSEFTLKTDLGHPSHIAEDKNGDFWITQTGVDKISRLDPTTSDVKEYSIPTFGGQPTSIIAGSDGKIWFTETSAGKIGSIDPITDEIKEYSLLKPTSGPRDLVFGPDNNLWVANTYADSIIKFSLNPIDYGTMTEYILPTIGAQIIDMKMGKDGNIWFTEWGGNQIGKLNPRNGHIDEYLIPGTPQLNGIAIGYDGNIWFTKQFGDKIVKMNTSGTIINEFTASDSYSELYHLATTMPTPDGSEPEYIWFTERLNNKIGVLEPITGKIVKFNLPKPTSQPYEIITGSDGSIWFAEQLANKVGKIKF